MKTVYRLTGICSFGIRREKLALLLNTLQWFLLGAAAGWLSGLVAGCDGEQIKTAAVSAGSLAALAIGFIGGVLWLAGGKMILQKTYRKITKT